MERLKMEGRLMIEVTELLSSKNVHHADQVVLLSDLISLIICFNCDRGRDLESAKMAIASLANHMTRQAEKVHDEEKRINADFARRKAGQTESSGGENVINFRAFTSKTKH